MNKEQTVFRGWPIIQVCFEGLTKSKKTLSGLTQASKSAVREPEALSLTHHTLHTVLILKPAQCPSIFKINFQAHYYNLKDKIHLSHTPSQQFIVSGS